MLIYDGSASMSEAKCSEPAQKYQVAREAVKDWAASLASEANLGLVAFHGVWTQLDLAPGNRDVFAETVQSVRPAGDTPLAEAFQKAYSLLTRQGRRQLGYGDYTIVVVTDGVANDLYRLQETVDKILAHTPITVYTIGFCIGENHSLNQPGRTIYKTADDPEALRQGLEQATAEAETFDVQNFQ